MTKYKDDSLNDLSPLLYTIHDWQMFRILADALPQIVWIGTPDGSHDYYNEKWFLYTGLTHEETQGWGWGPVLHPDDLPLCIAKWEHAVATGEVYEIEYRFKRASDGTYRWHLGRALPVKDAQGKIIKWFGTSTDIHDQKRAQLTLKHAFEKTEIEIEKRTTEIITMNTQLKKEIMERKEAESKLHTLNEQLQTILDANPHTVIATDLNGVITVFNRAAEKMLGYQAYEIIGKYKTTEFHTPEDIINCTQTISKKLNKKIEPDFNAYALLLEENDYYEMEANYIHKNGRKIPGHLTMTKLKDHKKNLIGYLGIVQDLTEKKKLDQMKGEFISIVSHELRTPLTSIYGTLALLINSGLYQFSNEAKKLLNIASNNSKRLINLVNDILDIEKIEAGKMVLNIEPIEMNQLIQEALILNQSLCDANAIRLTFHKLENAIIINADRARLHQVLTNLISNAVKFSKSNSEVLLQIILLSENKLRVAISDQGKGIPKDFQAMVFTKFSQADSSTVRNNEGTGLGLSICKAIIESLGGAINFSTKINEGSTFYFDLPIYRLLD